MSGPRIRHWIDRRGWGLHTFSFLDDFTITVRTPWRFFELHVGAYARKGEDPEVDAALEGLQWDQDVDVGLPSEPRLWS
jgi:hypothetical protein